MTATETKPVIEVPAKRKSVSPQSRSRPQPRRKKRYTGLVKLFRRTHMYFGLVLVPFVILYGLTAVFFNHPTWLNGGSTTIDNEPDLLSAHGGFPIDILTEEVRAAMEQDMNLPVELVGDPAFSGSFLFETRGDEERIRVRVQPSTLASTTQVTKLAVEDDSRTFPEKVETTIGERIDELKAEVESKTALESPSVRVAPDLEFQVRVDGEDWIVGYDLRNGQISERRVGELRRDFNLRSFLMRLHVSRGYPEEIGVRSMWGGIVDVTAMLMIFWAVSGVIMWWQMKPLRSAGGLALGGGVLMAGILAWGMYLALYL